MGRVIRSWERLLSFSINLNPSHQHFDQLLLLTHFLPQITMMWDSTIWIIYWFLSFYFSHWLFFLYHRCWIFHEPFIYQRDTTHQYHYLQNMRIHRNGDVIIYGFLLCTVGVGYGFVCFLFLFCFLDLFVGVLVCLIIWHFAIRYLCVFIQILEPCSSFIFWVLPTLLILD